MMRIIVIGLILSIFFCNTSCSQNMIAEKNTKVSLIGKYTSRNLSHSNSKHYEEIILKKDSTFKYFSRIGSFVQLNITGKWSILKNVLILDGNHLGAKKIVTIDTYKSTIPQGMVRFHVSHLDKSPINYSISATNGDTTVIMKNRFESTLLPLHAVDEFLVMGSLYHYPIVQVMTKESNNFIVKVSSSRLFIDEKWLIEGEGIIRPIGVDNEYARYVLIKEREE